MLKISHERQVLRFRGLSFFTQFLYFFLKVLDKQYYV